MAADHLHTTMLTYDKKKKKNLENKPGKKRRLRRSVQPERGV